MPVACTEQGALRDALAWRIEKVAMVVFAVVLGAVIVLMVRERRRKEARI